MINSIKPMTIAEMTLAMDRISRFKFPEKKLKRVYIETICANLKSPKFKKTDIEKFDNKSMAEFFEEIWNYSVLANFKEKSNDFSLNKKYIEEEKKCYVLSKEVTDLMPKSADFGTLIKNIKKIPNNFNDYMTPKKIVITEGITEETLLPVFSEIFGYDWKKNGVKIVSLGGKNQILRQYKIYKEQIKIPIYVLLDYDAKPIYERLSLEIRPIDKLHLISCGEIEDIIPVSIFKNAINHEYKSQVKISVNDFNKDLSMVENLHNIFKEKGLGEFKKSQMAQFIKQNISANARFSGEIESILSEIKNL